MAASKTVLRSASKTLVAATAWTFNITADSKAFVELLHHNDAPQPIFFAIAATEAALPAVTSLGDDLDCVVAGERITFPAFSHDKWVRVISAGIPTVTVTALT